MLKIYTELFSVFLFIFSGVSLRYFKIVRKGDASIFLNLVFYLTMPALVLSNLPSANIGFDYLYLPIIPVIVSTITFFIAKYTGQILQLENKTLGVFILSAIILNTAFLFPFVILFFKQEGLSRILFLDVGNVFMIFGLGYYQACKYGNHELTNKQIFKRFFNAIPLWAILVSILMNLLHLNLKGPFYGFVKIAGDLTIPLLLISVGIFFELRLVKLKALFIALFIRMGIGMILGILVAHILGLEGLTKAIAILGTATPIGYNTLMFASIENLDKEFAAALVSTSILISLIYIPLMIYFVI